MNNSDFTELLDGLDGASERILEFADNADLSGDLIEQFKTHITSTARATSSFSKVIKFASGALGSFASFGINAFASIAISKGIELAITAIDNYIHKTEKLIEAGNKAQESIDSTFDGFSQSKSSLIELGVSVSDDEIKTANHAIDELAEKYVELSDGVNDFNNTNTSLSTEDYEQYIKLSNEIAEQFPSLVSGYDSQGNAILNLGNNASDAASKIRELYDAQQLAANIEIGNNLQALYDGISAQVGEYQKEIGNLEEVSDSAQNIANLIENNIAPQLFNGQINLDMNSLGDSYNDYLDELYKIAEEVGVALSETQISGGLNQLTGETILGSTNIDILGATEEQLTEFERRLQNYNNAISEEYSHAFNNSQKQIFTNDLMINDKWKSMSVSLGKYLQTSETFTNLDFGIQDAVINNIKDLDLTKLKDANLYNGNVEQFLYGELIEPLSSLDEDAQKALTDLFALDESSMSVTEYSNQVSQLLKQAFPDNDQFNSWLNNFGIKDIVSENANQILKLKSKYQDFTTQIDNFSNKEIDIAVDLLTDGFDGSFEELKTKIEEVKNPKIEVEPVLFSDLLKDDSDTGISKTIDNFQTNINAINSALESLKNGEKVDLTDLLQQFPELIGKTDDLESSLTSLTFDKLDEFSTEWTQTVEKVKDNKGELEKASAMFQAVIDNLDFSKADTGDLANKAIENIWSMVYAGLMDSSTAVDILSKLSEQLSTHDGAQAVLEISADPTNAYDSAEQFISDVESKEVEIKLKADKQALEDSIKHIQNEMDLNNARSDKFESELTLKEAQGQSVTSFDYNRRIGYEGINQNYLNNLISEKEKLLALDVANESLSPDEYYDRTQEIIGYQAQLYESMQKQAQAEKDREYLPIKNMQREFTSLGLEATDLQNRLSDKELYGLKVSKKDYHDLIDNSNDQIENLELQNKTLESLIKKYEDEGWLERAQEYSDELESNKETIHDLKNSQYEWNQAIKNLPLSNIRNLSSSLSEVFTQLSSETGIASETFESIITQFSDLKDFDIADVFYRSQEGVKADTDALQDLAEQQYKITMSQFDKDIERQTQAIEEYQDQIGKGNVDSTLTAMQDELETLLLRQVEYYAEYKAQMEQFSDYNMVQIAKSTENAGDKYLQTMEDINTAYESYQKGLVGTDDFKSVAKLLSPNGFTDPENFAENYNKAKRYFSEDSSGMWNFLNDLEAKGLAEFNKEANEWTYNISNMKKAADSMGISTEVLEMGLGRLEDYGFMSVYVDSLEDGKFKTEELAHELGVARAKYAELVAQGASADILADQQAVIDQTLAQMDLLNENIDTFAEESARSFVEGFKSVPKYLKEIQKQYEEASTFEEKKEIVDTASRYLDDYGVKLNITDLGINIDDSKYQQIAEQIKLGSWIEPLSASDFGYDVGSEEAENFIAIQNKAKEVYEENASVFSELSQYTASQLKEIALGDSQYNVSGLESAEDALESFAKSVGYSSQETGLLVDALISLGIVQPDMDYKEVKKFTDEVYASRTELEELQNSGVISEGINLDFNIEEMSTEDIQNKIDELSIEKESLININTDESKRAIAALDIQLNALRDKQISVGIETSGMTIEELLELDQTELASVLQIDTTEAEYARQKLEELKNITSEVAMTVKLDESQFSQLVPQQESTVTVKANTDEAKKSVDGFVEETNKKTSTIKVSANTSLALQMANNAYYYINNLKPSIKVSADTSSIRRQITNALSGAFLISLIAKLFHTGTMTSIASHASGTVPYNVLNTTPAYANGKISLPKNETALINELGQESVIRNGEWHLLPPGMHFENLKKGDIILNHKQTKSLIEHGNALGNGHVRGYANGTLLSSAYAGGSGVGSLPNGSSGNGGSGNGSSGNGGSGNGGSGNGGSDSSNEFKEIFDWIERKIQKFQRLFDNWFNQAQTALTTTFINKYYKNATKHLNSLMQTHADGYVRYMKEADSVGLSDKYKDLVKSGKIDIQTITDKDLATKIQDYEKWYRLALSSADEFVSSAQQLYNLPIEKATQKIEDLNDALELLDAKLENASSYKTQNKIIDQQIAKQKDILDSYTVASIETQTNLDSIGKYVASLDSSYMDYVLNGKEIDLTKLTEGTELYNAVVKYNEALKADVKADNELLLANEEYEKFLRESAMSKFENVSNYYENKLDMLNYGYDELQGYVDRYETAGRSVNIAYYKSQQDNTKQQYNTLKKEKAALEEQLNIIERGTDEWYEAYEAIQDVKSEMTDMHIQMDELNNAINQSFFDMYDNIHAEVERLMSEQEFIRSLFSHEKNIDSDTGLFTDAGIGNLTSLVASMYASQENEKQSSSIVEQLKMMKELGKLSNDIFTFNSINDLEAELEKYYDIWQNDIKTTYDMQTNLYNVMSEYYQTQLTLQKELIDDKKEALKAEKDLYDYQNKIREKTEDIDLLHRRLSAYSGDTSEEGRATIQKLQSELADAEKDLQETEYDRYISDQEDMLDGLYEEFEEIITTKLENFEGIVQEGLDLANQKADIGNNFLNQLVEKTDYVPENSTLSSSGQMVIDVLPKISEYLSTGNSINESIKMAIADLTSSIVDWEVKYSGTADKAPSSSDVSDTVNPAQKTNADLLKIAKDYIKKNVSNAAKEHSEYSDLNKVLYSDKANAYSGTKKVLSSSELKELAKLLGLQYDDASSTGALYKKLVEIGYIDENELSKINADIQKALNDSKNDTSKNNNSSTNNSNNSSKPNNSNTTNNSTNNKNDVWKNIKTNTADKGNSRLDKDVSIIDRMKYFGYAYDSTARKQLWSNLGGSGTYVGSASQNTWMISALKKAGFSKGGLVDEINNVVKKNGDDVIGTLKIGERVLTPTGNKDYEKLMSNLNKMMDSGSFVYMLANANGYKNTTTLPSGANPTSVTMHTEMPISISIQNATNAYDIVRAIQNDRKVQQAIQSVSVDKLVGGGRLSVNLIK